MMLDKKLDIRTKSILFLEMSVLTFAFHDPRIMASLFLLVLVTAFVVHVSLKKIFQYLLPLLPLILLVFICTTLNFSHLHQGGLSEAFTYTFRILIFIMASLIIQQSTSQKDMMQLFQWLRLPAEISFLFITALRFIPALNKKRLQITEAQKARGSLSHQRGFFRPLRSFIPIVIPLFANSIQMANSLSVSLVSRGFGYAKTWMPEYKRPLPKRDILLLSVSTVLFLGAVAWKIVS